MFTDKEKALRKAEKYVLRGNIPAAINQVRRVVDEDPEDLTSTNTLGDLYVRAGEISAAIPHFTRIADRYREGGFTLKAIGVLKKVARLDETNIAAAMELAGLYFERGLLVEARRQYLQIAATSERACQPQTVRAAFQKIAEMEPSNTAAVLKLAELCESDGLLEEASDWQLLACERFAQQEEHDQALEASLKALALCQDNLPAVAAVATCYSNKGLVDLSVDTLSQAIERKGGDVELRILLGRTYLAARLAKDAERVFTSLIESDPNACSYLIEVGHCFLDLGECDEVVRLMDAHLEVMIATAQVSRAVGLLRLILVRDEGHLGALKRLANIFQRTNRADELVATLTTLAETAAANGAEEQAMEALDALEELTPRGSDALPDQPVADNQHTTCGDSWEFAPSMETPEPAADENPDWQAVVSSGPEPTLHEGLTALANENVLIHVALKEIYQQAGSISEAATKCVELARIHEARGESSRATEYLAEAQRLSRSVKPLPPSELPPEEPAGSRSGIILPVGSAWPGREGVLSLQLQPVEYNLAQFMGKLSSGESLGTACVEPGELEISSDAIAEIDERFRGCSARDASAGEIYEAYRLAIGSLTRASRHSRVQSDAAVRQKLSRAYLTVVEAFSSLLCLAEGVEDQDLVDGWLDTSAPACLSQSQLLDVVHGIQGAETPLVVSDHWANRRKVARYAQRLPVLVSANSGTWRELTESLDVSALGMRFRLSRAVEPGTALCIQVAMPEHLRLHRHEGRIYAVRAVVCHQVEDTGGNRLVGAEFGAVLEGMTGRSELMTANGSFYQPNPTEMRTAL
jgi:tetratricopeptide (TPR) repeat protein